MREKGTVWSFTKSSKLLKQHLSGKIFCKNLTWCLVILFEKPFLLKIHLQEACYYILAKLLARVAVNITCTSRGPAQIKAIPGSSQDSQYHPAFEVERFEHGQLEIKGNATFIDKCPATTCAA